MKKRKTKSAPPSGSALEGRVRKLEEVSDQNTSVFVDVIRHLEARVISLEMVIAQIHAKDEVTVTSDGRIDWDSYHTHVRSLVSAPDESSNDAQDELQFDPDAERAEEDPLPEGARIFGMT